MARVHGWRNARRAAATAMLCGAVLASLSGVAAAASKTYYLAVGASESVGYQPAHAGHPAGPTDQGYANDVAAMEQQRWTGLTLADLGCPGITAQGALDGHGACHYRAGSQIATASDFLHAHYGHVALVTVDLGFNDIWRCLGHRTVDATCVTTALVRIEESVPVVLAELRAAGGPGVEIVGLLHDDPYLGDMLDGSAPFAHASFGVMRRLNGELGAIYAAAGAQIADVPAVSGTAAGSRVGALQICKLTWMCRAHNLHPDAAGYQAIAGAVAAAIARTQVPG